MYELYRRIAVRALTPVLSLIVLGGKASIMVRMTCLRSKSFVMWCWDVVDACIHNIQAIIDGMEEC